MKTIIKRKINDAVVEFEVDEKDFRDLMTTVTFLTERDYCPVPGFTDSNVRWEVNKAKDKQGKEFTYIKRKAFSKDGRIVSSTAGEFQSGGYFWKKWEEYVPKDRPSQTVDELNIEQSELPNPADIPF